MPTPERISIEVTRRCSKGCAFCYNASDLDGTSGWTPGALIAFGRDCAAHGTRAISLGGGEPLEYPGLLEVLAGLEGRVFRSLTTNGLLLRGERLDTLIRARPDKVHVSIHFPHRPREVSRVISQVLELRAAGVDAGINLLVARSSLKHAEAAAAAARAAGIHNDRIVYLPMRSPGETPTPREIARVAGDLRFQSMTCLLTCGPSPRYCSISHDRHLSLCSYTSSRVRLPTPTTALALEQALRGLDLRYCGDASRPERVKKDQDL